MSAIADIENAIPEAARPMVAELLAELAKLSIEEIAAIVKDAKERARQASAAAALRLADVVDAGLDVVEGEKVKP